LEYLQNGAIRTTQEITRAVKERVELTSEDRKQAAKRHAESKVDQIIANALQSKRRLCRGGLIERVERGTFRITASGALYLAEQRKSFEFMSELLDGMSDWRIENGALDGLGELRS
jgi:restriction endonuclease Mrr